jgi:double-stranded RNA-specific adenosine deaminase
LRFMYQQLMDTNPGDENSLFEPSCDPNCPDKFRVKSHISFHLYISTAPCGDGALFSPRDTESGVYDACDNSADHQPTFNSNVQGLLRTKMEGGEGTIPVEADFGGQTWDGIMRGERLRTMSCSDKIAKWNVTGMQGALLSHFLEPIYLQSVTLGYLFDHGHLARAICCRLTRAEPEISEVLPAEKLFKLHHPELGRVTVYDPPRETEKTKSVSINWTIGDEKPEVTDGSRGVCVDRYGDRTVGPSATVIANASQDARPNGSPNMINGKPGSPGSSSSGIGGGPISQLCKSLIYGHYKRVCEKYNREDLLAHKSYYAAKKAASDYQRAVRAVEDAFKSAGFGTWVKKPIEEQMFR